ncbi:MAG: hypothetical protein KGJ86_19860, partial [Chloroflexota bacterium]|nr:hypothetical protein [Chloroflexota bacterium]
FPVFAQAREEARKTVCLSNVRQLATANEMYIQDYDEQVVLDLASDPAGTVLYTWQDLVQPYTKSYPILNCPDAPSGWDGGPPDYGYWLSYGINGRAAIQGFPYWTTRGPGSWFQQYIAAGVEYDGIAGDADLHHFYYPNAVNSLALANVARPSEYVFIQDAGNFDAWHGIFAMQSAMGWCGAWVDPAKYPGQGTSANPAYAFFGPQPRHSGGSQFCYVATRATTYGEGIANIAFLDGHAKGMKAGQWLQILPGSTNGGAPGELNYFEPNQ